jgi:predicted CXXCH cytochrome family protein
MKAEGARVHGALEGSDCLECHRGHGSNEARLLRDGPPALCAGCHDLAAPEVAARHGGFDVAQADCLSCHVPHAAKRGLLRAEGHMPFTDGTCDACHLAPKAPPAPAAQKPGGLARCADCHDFAEVTGAKRPHAPVKRGECFACHAPHVADAPHLLRAAGTALCQRCHDLSASRVKARHGKLDLAAADCARCHAPHAPLPVKQGR